MQSPPSVRPSVCPSRYLLLNRWTKFNQIWCVSCSHGKGVQRHFFFCPAPWGPGEGPKGQILLNIIKFQLQSQFQRFLNQTLCVFSQMFVCFVCFCCFTSHVNSYGHCGMVSSLNHTFSRAGLSKRLTSNLCTYFRL